MKKGPFPELLGRVEAELGRRLRATLSRAQSETKGRGAEVQAMVRAAAALSLRGGKRLRAALCVIGGLASDESAPRQPLLQAGVALELLQAYFLIHDDWMDGDELRRGGPTTHVELSRFFGSEVLGAQSAILAGDHTLALAQAELARVKTSPTRLVQALAVFARMQLDAVAGQERDIAGAKDIELTYALKTSSYTVTGPLLLGAKVAGASPTAERALTAFGGPAGIAFQLRDDLIGVFGDPALTGKPRGADLTAGKRTYLAQMAERRMTPRQRSRFDRVFGNRKARARDVEAVVSDLEASGAPDAVERRIRALTRKAEESLEARGLTPTGRGLLRGALDALVVRRA